jgi:hypothetical protein
MSRVKIIEKKLLEDQNVIFDTKDLKALSAIRMHEATRKMLEHVVSEQEEELERLKKRIDALESVLNPEPLFA